MPTNTKSDTEQPVPAAAPKRRRAAAKKPKAPRTKPAAQKTTSRTNQPKPSVELPHELATIWEEIAPRQGFDGKAQPPAVHRTFNYWKSLGWLALAMLGVLMITTSTTLFALQQNQPVAPSEPAIPQEPEVTEPTTTSLLTGLSIVQSAAERRPWAVVVENLPPVRPQSGLSKADIVFESPTEGGITRFVAIFQSQLPTEVGPVRSARSFFNDWIRPFAPLFSHSGGSEKALRQLSQGYGSIQDVNEFYNGSAYLRKTTTEAPHNLFAPVAAFMDFVNKKNWLKAQTITPAFSFGPLPETGSIAHSVTIPYSPREYSVRYDYRSLTGRYLRAADGTTLTDSLTKEPIEVANVITLFTDIDPIPGDALKRVELRTLGTGPMVLYTGGRAFAGTWSKKTPDDMISFADSAGTPLVLSPGNTWISILDTAQQKQVIVETPELTP